MRRDFALFFESKIDRKRETMSNVDTKDDNSSSVKTTIDDDCKHPMETNGSTINDRTNEQLTIDDDDIETIKLFKNRSDWLDIHPIFNSDMENSVVPIAASEQCKFRYVFVI